MLTAIIGKSISSQFMRTICEFAASDYCGELFKTNMNECSLCVSEKNELNVIDSIAESYKWTRLSASYLIIYHHRICIIQATVCLAVVAYLHLPLLLRLPPQNRERRESFIRV